MKLLNSKSILDCDENEEQQHNDELMKIFEHLVSIKDYPCALVCKYQDEAHNKLDNQIYNCQLSEVFDEIQKFDMKNGVDLFLDENGFMNMLIYGQGYTYQDKYSLITMGIKILPYDEQRNFLDLTDSIYQGSNAKISKQQFNNLYS